jgi:hypothetical protein
MYATINIYCENTCCKKIMLPTINVSKEKLSAGIN